MAKKEVTRLGGAGQKPRAEGPPSASGPRKCGAAGKDAGGKEMVPPDRVTVNVAGWFLSGLFTVAF